MSATTISTTQTPPAGHGVETLPVGGDAVEAAAWASLMISDAQCGTAAERIKTAQTDRDLCMKKARQALEEARQQEEEKSFWEEIASTAQTVGTVAAAVAAVAATGGAAAPVVILAVAGAGCSLTSEAMRQGWVPGGDEKLFSIGDFEVGLGDGLALTGMAAGGFAGGATLLCENAGQASAFVRGVGLAAQGTRAGAGAVQAGATYESGRYMAEATDSRTDAKQEAMIARRLETTVDEQIDIVQAATESRSRALKAVISMVETQNAAIQAAMGSRA